METCNVAEPHCLFCLLIKMLGFSSSSPSPIILCCGMINCCGVFLEYVDVVSRILEWGKEDSGMLYSLFRVVQLVITTHIFMLFLSLYPSLPLFSSVSCFMSAVNCVLMFLQTCDGASTLSSPNTAESCPFTRTHTHKCSCLFKYTSNLLSAYRHASLHALLHTSICNGCIQIHATFHFTIVCYYLSNKFPIIFIFLCFFPNP